MPDVSPKPRLLLCDDHPIILVGLRALLADDFEVVAVASDGRQAVAEAQRLVPDVAVLDISLPLLNGIEAARQIHLALPQIKILFLSQNADRDYVLAAMRLGASGYIIKQDVAAEIVKAVHEVSQGRTYLAAPFRTGLTAGSFDASSGNLDDLFGERLTSRQREVLQLLAEGKSGKEISAILNISVKTVDFHKAGIMDELGIRTTAELTRYAIRHGIS